MAIISRNNNSFFGVGPQDPGGQAYQGNFVTGTASNGSLILANLYTTSDDLHQIRPTDNYIYLYHEGIYIMLPSSAESVHDSMQASFAVTTIPGRSAPIYSYQNSGPRSLSVTFKLHRDMMKQINQGESNVLDNVTDQFKQPENDDYVDILINYLQGMVLPSYEDSQKRINPPMVALRLGNDIFIKGVVNGQLGIQYDFPILRTGKYAVANVSFTITEVDPYDAETAMRTGSFRGLSTTLSGRLWLESQINTAGTSAPPSSMNDNEVIDGESKQDVGKIEDDQDSAVIIPVDFQEFMDFIRAVRPDLHDMNYIKQLFTEYLKAPLTWGIAGSGGTKIVLGMKGSSTWIRNEEY